MFGIPLFPEGASTIAPEVDALRLSRLAAEQENAAIEKGSASTNLDDAEATQVIRKQVKQRQDSIASFEGAGRSELAAKEQAELEMLNGYLPQAMSAEFSSIRRS